MSSTLPSGHAPTTPSTRDPVQVDVDRDFEMRHQHAAAFASREEVKMSRVHSERLQQELARYARACDETADLLTQCLEATRQEGEPSCEVLRHGIAEGARQLLMRLRDSTAFGDLNQPRDTDPDVVTSCKPVRLPSCRPLEGLTLDALPGD